MSDKVDERVKKYMSLTEEEVDKIAEDEELLEKAREISGFQERIDQLYFEMYSKALEIANKLEESQTNVQLQTEVSSVIDKMLED